MNNTRTLLGFMDRSRSRKKAQSQNKMRKTKLSFQLKDSKDKYIDFTNLTKSQQVSEVKSMIKTRKNWKYDFYRNDKNFSVCQQEQMQRFPGNNQKYNTQFLNRSLHGESLKFPVKDLGVFPKTERKHYSSHYRPILDEKIKYNEDYQLRASLFGRIWLDDKRDRIMDKYKIQMNPFHTKRRNQLLSTMSVWQ